MEGGLEHKVEAGIRIFTLRSAHCFIYHRAQIISDLHQLVVRRDRLSADDFESTLLAQQTLRGKHFHEALLSHDSLAAAGLTPEQQKAPLESALREYKLALSNAHYLLSRNMPAVDSSQLEAYIVELNLLISLGEDDMANLAAETDRQDAVPEQPLTHRARKQLKPNDFLDVYDIYRLQPRQKLWEAHFHYTTATANARRFAKGHLKFPEAMGRDERLQRAQASAERCPVYRGDLRLDQIEDLIPVPAS